MRAEIIAVGTEILLGDILNSNTRFLSRELASLGIDVYYHTTVGDNQNRLTEQLRVSKERADLIIVTGGLGPTYDDLTRQTIAEVFESPLVAREEDTDYLFSLYQGKGEPTQYFLQQASVPFGSYILENNNGTALGFILKKESIVIALPGPPRELEPMFLESVKPYLRELGLTEVIHSKTLRLVGIPEANVEELLGEYFKEQNNPTIAPYAKFGEVHLRITAKAASISEAKDMIEPVENHVKKYLGEYIYGSDEDTLEEIVARLLRENRVRLAIAESCTGGLLSHRLTNVPGSSDYFIAGLITYANEAKQELLNVPLETIKQYGAVSKETAIAMAEGLLANYDIDMALAITGIAGPTGGTEEKPVGTVHIAIANKDRTEVYSKSFSGNRETIKFRSTQAALDELRRWLRG